MKTYFSTFLFLLLLLSSARSFGFSALPSITFYGRVIDQYGQPVKNANIWYSGENSFLSTGGGSSSTITDNDGYFMIDTTGAALELGSISHPEIDEISYRSPRALVDSSRDVRESTIRFLENGDNKYALNWNDYTEKNKAYVIQASRLANYEGANQGGLNGYYNLDGREYTLDLLGKNYKNKVKEGVHEGQLIVSCTRKNKMEGHMDYGDWTATITPINGGIQVTNDLYMNEAPVSDYKASIYIDMKFGTNKYRNRLLNKRYYFMANNGKTYGSLFVNYQPHARDKDSLCRINIKTYIVNPTGSRNLTLRKSKIEIVKEIN